MSPILLVADIDESGLLRCFHPDWAHRTEETATGLRAALSANAPASGRPCPLLTRRRACAGNRAGGSGATDGSHSCYGARRGLARGVFALVNWALGGSDGQWERARGRCGFGGSAQAWTDGGPGPRPLALGLLVLCKHNVTRSALVMTDIAHMAGYLMPASRLT